MHKRAAVSVIIAAVLLGGAAAAQMAGEAPIPSDRADALPPPDRWDCDLYRAEYREFIEQGNPAETWRFAGRMYRDVGTGATYDWNDWLAWSAQADCPALPILVQNAGGGAAASGSAAGTAGAGAAGGLGAFVGFAGITALAVSGNAKSPG